jgi:hypothetical protein
MPEPIERRDGSDLVIAQMLLTLAGIVAVLPALLVAVALAITIDRRGWRRWPMLLAGSAATAAAVALGADDTYLAVGRDLWAAAKHGATFSWTHLLGLAPLGLTAGVALGPVVQVAANHHNEHEDTRHHRQQSVGRRARVQAERRIRRPIEVAPPDRWSSDTTR